MTKEKSWEDVKQELEEHYFETDQSNTFRKLVNQSSVIELDDCPRCGQAHPIVCMKFDEPAGKTDDLTHYGFCMNEVAPVVFWEKEEKDLDEEEMLKQWVFGQGDDVS